MNRLYTRLLLSYTLIILVTLAVIGGALVLFLRSGPVPATGVYQRLNDLARGAAAYLNDGESERPRSLAQILDNLRELSEATELRILVASEDGKRVFFDSLNHIASGQPLPEYRVDPQRSGPNLVLGEFTDPEDQSKWLFIARLPGANLLRPEGGPRPDSRRFILLAMPMPEPSLGLTLQPFGDELIMTLVQAGLVGLVVAVVLAALIARSVARPLQQTARAAEAVAAGDLNQQVPEEGPTEVRTLAHTFNHMTHAVQAGQQAQRDFVANVSHDLRTPLTAIKGFSQAILDGAAASPDGVARAASIIHDESARMVRMVEELLDLARLESGQLRMERAVVSPARLLRTVADRFTLQAQAQEVELKTDLPDDLPDIVGDGDRLVQVFANLVDNALKYTPAGGTVTLSGAASERAQGARGVELAVSDTGAGIPQADLARIFERFYQVDKARARDARRQGTGLGLAISKEIVAAHGGVIHAESVTGLGSRFVVWLPVSA
ncbi:MAG: HAMP domain-containing protein [Anaerolineae bacterium]|nr:HAMP domain-containing protein [Anaerolineae bacterium]